MTKRFRGTHVTRYDYTEPVFLGPHVVRLRPRSDPGQKLHAFEISFDPEPEGVTGGLDAWGNNVTWAWFSGEHRRLEITTRFEAERTRLNPFDFVVLSPEGSELPPVYELDEELALEPFMHRRDIDPSVRELTEQVAEETNHKIIEFLSELSSRIHERCEMIVRPVGDPFPPEKTLAEGAGSCRDLTVLYIAACRHAGIASRFVSGYVEHRPEGEPRELHAWAGVYVPGGGWRGYDPSQGLAVSNGHLTCAVAASPKGAGPVSGMFRSSGGAQATLSAEVDLEVAEG